MRATGPAGLNTDSGAAPHPVNPRSDATPPTAHHRVRNHRQKAKADTPPIVCWCPATVPGRKPGDTF